MASFLVILLAFLSAVNAAVLSANYPINAQLPPVARVSQPFSFIFAEDTFANADSETKYSLSDAPAWLEVDSKSRTLSGTPHSDDDGSNAFKLVASNGSGSDSMDVTLIVTSDKGPTKGKSLVSQLETLGPVSYPATLFIHPGRPFSITFDPDTFQNTHPATIYYGTSPNNTPLPSWIGFDPYTLTFAGNSPSFPGAGPQTFTFQLIASDVAGYSAVNETFQLSIGPHILAFNETVQRFNLTRGDKFSTPDFQSFLSLDSSPVSSINVKSVDANLPDWLTMDDDKISLAGTPPKDAVNQNITITATDIFQDQAKLMVRLEFLELFLETVEGCEATIGEDFMFVFNQSILTDNAVQLDVELDKDLSSWLVYYSENKTLYGHVPGDMKPQKFTIPLKASQGSTTDSQDFDIDVLEPAETHNGNHDPFSDPSGHSHQKAGIIAISVVIPLVVVLSAIILFCCWRRRRKTSTVEEGEFKAKPSPPPRPARPDMPPNCQPGVTERPSRDDNSDDWMSPITPTSDLLKLELGPSWNVSSFDKQEDTMNMNVIPEPNPPPRSPRRSAFVPLRDSIIERDKAVDISPSKKQSKRLSYARSPPVRRRSGKGSRREPLKASQPRVAKRESIQSSRSKRYSKRSSGISSVASGLPVRLSGAGHGAGGFGPPGHGMVHMSWQTTKGSLMSDESSLTNMTPLFPRPPLAPIRHSMTPSIPQNHRRVTMRAVEPDESTISEADSLEAFVHSRAKHRNSSNPLFSAQISRRTSSGIRALERARSIRSRADTVSVSTFSDEFRQSIQGRPYSTALSVSEYGDENNRFSQYQTLQAPPNLFPLAEGHGQSQSQLSLAQDYRGVISPLPRFWSEASLNSAQRLESGSHPKPRPRAQESSAVPQSSSMVSDLEVHLSRKASPQKSANHTSGDWQTINEPLEPPPPVKSASSRGLPVASSGELAFV
ncbi:uncharacterized protein N7498_004285 [Penicillium cinerascens]|uniref:Dystroglycan-type cadherin-like domain-containing protein n=1 Tax=Penicillium cinerascens TaxID=70096 RepID=A0A9W9N3R2_9EURO|nr:uncharacterized protein N7498_004285 [Penicillium cinerascens]KAJ5212639.1 hypothetical protein N7498_004285 [Penicillium cinerascens]